MISSMEEMFLLANSSLSTADNLRLCLLSALNKIKQLEAMIEEKK